MSATERADFTTRRASRSWVLGAALAASIVLWWIALRWWAELNLGYLDIDALGVSAFIWIGLMAASAGVMTFGPVGWARAVLAVLAAAAVVVALFELAGGLADGSMSQAAWPIALISTAQLAMIASGALVTRR